MHACGDLGRYPRRVSDTGYGDFEFERGTGNGGQVLKFRVVCPKCEHASKSRGSFLGQKVRCPKCETDFVAEWGEPEAISK